jgi:predicted ATPase
MKIPHGKKSDKASIGRTELTTMKAVARKRFSSLRDVQESHENLSSTFSVGSSPSLGVSSAGSQGCLGVELDIENLKLLEENTRTIHALRTSKERCELQKISALISNRIGYSTRDRGLHGRDEETALLNSYFESILPPEPGTKEGTVTHHHQPGPRRSLVLVKGPSGVGKSALVATLKNPIKKHKGLYVQGKFDLFLRDAQPYSGIIMACREVCHEISALNGNFFADIQLQLKTQLGRNLHILANVIPELYSIVDWKLPTRGISGSNSISSVSMGHAPVVSGHQARDQFLYAFRILFRIITACFTPFTMVLDDLQWADVASLELVESLLTDRENNHFFLIVGLFRSDEVDMCTGSGRHILTTMINELQEKANKEENLLIMREIQVGNLNLQGVKSVTMDLLSLDDTPTTVELAELCHKRTLGNVFFLISFLAMLEEEGFLKYSLHSGTYTWDLEKIKYETGASSNVVSLVNRKLSRLSEDYTLLLSLAACIGSTFDITKLEILWTAYCKRFADKIVKDSTGLEDRLAQAVHDGYLESFDNIKFHWIHDGVQEAALTLIPEAEAANFKCRIGDILRQELTEDDLDASIFLVTNLLNEAPIETLQEQERIRLAELNLRATQKAVSFSAFTSAAKYAGAGIDLLLPNCWTNNYHLALGLYSFAAEANDFIGDHGRMKKCCDVVLELNEINCPIHDKLRIYYVLAYNAANAGEAQQAVDLIQGVLAKLGCKFPKSTAGRLCATLAGFWRMHGALKSQTKEDIAAMPDMIDERQIEIMRLLSKFCQYTYLVGSDLVALAILKGLRLTLKHGLCEYSPPFFSIFGTVCCGMLNDPQGASKIGEDALVLVNKLNSQSTKASTKYMVAGCSFSWTKPFANVTPLLLESYQDGISTGDNESAGFVCTHVQLFGMFMYYQQIVFSLFCLVSKGNGVVYNTLLYVWSVAPTSEGRLRQLHQADEGYETTTNGGPTVTRTSSDRKFDTTSRGSWCDPREYPS